MKIKIFAVALIFFLSMIFKSQAQSNVDTVKPKKYQAKAPATKPFGADAFKKRNTTTVRWLGMAGFLINSRGTTMMVDPLLEGFDMPIMIEFPIAPKSVPKLDAVGYTCRQ